MLLDTFLLVCVDIFMYICNVISYETCVYTILAICCILVLKSGIPVEQDEKYHNFADKRNLCCVNNSFDVLSNIPFVFIGLLGLLNTNDMSEIIFFIGCILTCIGSMYYHLNPNNYTLVYDRLPMTLCFMSMLNKNVFNNNYALIISLLIGIASVCYWMISGDLKFYVLVQFVPFIIILCNGKFLEYYYGIIFYFLATVCEQYDREIFLLTRKTVSGHTIKHLCAACAMYTII